MARMPTSTRRRRKATSSGCGDASEIHGAPLELCLGLDDDVGLGDRKAPRRSGGDAVLGADRRRRLEDLASTSGSSFPSRKAASTSSSLRSGSASRRARRSRTCGVVEARWYAPVGHRRRRGTRKCEAMEPICCRGLPADQAVGKRRSDGAVEHQAGSVAGFRRGRSRHGRTRCIGRR